MGARAAAWLLCGLAAVPGAAAHGMMNRPPVRNNKGQQPIWKKNHKSDGPGCAGEACGWFNQGCIIGCTCSGKTKNCCGDACDCDPPFYSTPEQSSCPNPIEPTLAADSPLRTWNMELKSGKGDWTKYFPWRAPGSATPIDPCGVATDPVADGYKPHAKGSEIPEPKGLAPTQWPAGGTVVVSHALQINHGGGYQYRLCPKAADGALPSEACFQAHVLPFASNSSTIHWEDGSRADVSIPATDVTEGVVPAGSAWRRGPIPACNCDENDDCGSRGTSMKPYKKESGYGPQCPTGLQFKPLCDGCWGWSDDQPEWSLTFSIMDEVRVPSKAGAYHLSWRWDCEQTPQVWNSCADVVVA